MAIQIRTLEMEKTVDGVFEESGARISCSAIPKKKRDSWVKSHSKKIGKDLITDYALVYKAALQYSILGWSGITGEGGKEVPFKESEILKVLECLPVDLFDRLSDFVSGLTFKELGESEGEDSNPKS